MEYPNLTDQLLYNSHTRLAAALQLALLSGPCLVSCPCSTTAEPGYLPSIVLSTVHPPLVHPPQCIHHFTQVCVGATCPEERLHLLLPLLEPNGGKLLAPVDNDLRLYTRTPDGKLKQRVVSSVRFSDLEVGGQQHLHAGLLTGVNLTGALSHSGGLVTGIDFTGALTCNVHAGLVTGVDLTGPGALTYNVCHEVEVTLAALPARGADTKAHKQKKQRDEQCHVAT